MELMWANHFFLRTVIMEDRTYCLILFLVKNHMTAMASALLNCSLPHSQYRTLESPSQLHSASSNDLKWQSFHTHQQLGCSQANSSVENMDSRRIFETHKVCLQCSHPTCLVQMPTYLLLMDIQDPPTTQSSTEGALDSSLLPVFFPYEKCSNKSESLIGLWQRWNECI